LPDWLFYYAALIPITVLGGFARGVTGFGGPFVMLPVYFIGLLLGFRLYTRMNDATLRRVIILFVLIVTTAGLAAEFF
jgi:uncharacterized membrane protein YfcA